MNPDLILMIILESLKLTNNIIEGIPVAEREKIWLDHQKRLEFWFKLFEKLNPPTQTQTPKPQAGGTQ